MLGPLKVVCQGNTLVELSFTKLNTYFFRRGDLLMEINIILRLDGLNFICYLSYQRSSSNKSAWSPLQSSSLEMIPYKSASLAKS